MAMEPEVRRALDSGEYCKVVSLLQPLQEKLSASNWEGAELRLWLATAYQGLGDQAQAVACCREVLMAGSSEQRRQAQAVLTIIEAPVLQRPKEWSIELPSLGSSPPLEGLAKGAGPGGRKLLAKTLKPPAPPVGKTKAPLGFALVASLVFVVITLLLSGCMRLDGTIEFHGPGRFQFQQQLQGQAQVRSAVLTMGQLEPLIIKKLDQLELEYGISLPAPQINWRERNWLIGVQQQIQLNWDLAELDPLAGLSLHLHFRPLSQKAVRYAEPLEVIGEELNSLDWQLLPGAVNNFAFSCWRWSVLGLGSVVIALLLCLSLLLQILSFKAPLGRDRSPAAPL
jgi:FimV-like protein